MGWRGLKKVKEGLNSPAAQIFEGAYSAPARLTQADQRKMDDFDRQEKGYFNKQSAAMCDKMIRNYKLNV